MSSAAHSGELTTEGGRVMWRGTLLAAAISTAVLSAQVEPRSGIHREDMDPASGARTSGATRTADGSTRIPFRRACRPGDRSRKLTDANRERMRSLLEAAAADRTAPAGSPRKKMGDLYASCMDTAAIAVRGVAPLQPDLEIAAVRTQQDLARLLTSTADRVACGRLEPWPGHRRVDCHQDPIRRIHRGSSLRSTSTREPAAPARRSSRYPTATTTSRRIPSRRRFETHS